MTLLPLTTRERAKRRAGQTDPSLANTNMDALFDALILAVSASIEQYLGLPAGAMYGSQRTEVFSGAAWQSEVALRGVAPGMTPTVASVKTRDDWTTAWADATALTADTDFHVGEEVPWRIAFAVSPPVGRDTVQVVYTAGFVAEFGSGETIADSTDDLIAAFPALADAADAQIVYEYERRKTPGQIAMAVNGATNSQPEVRLLTAVMDRLAPYRRVWL